MTDSAGPGHSPDMGAALALSAEAPGVTPGGLLDFDEIYASNVDFVWRSLKRLGVVAASLDDAVQEVFVVVHRRLGDFEGRSTVRTWLYGIALRVARDHRRSRQARTPHEQISDTLPDTASPVPDEAVARVQAVETLDRLLGELDDDKREVFVLAEIEQLSAPEMAEVLGANVNTVYSRLRAARRAFEQALERYHARRRRVDP